MTSFLLWIGAYNAAGAVFLLALLNERFAEKVLAKWVQVIVAPYSHGSHGRLWIWWSATTNLGLGLVMVQASQWPVDVQRRIIASVIAVYAIMSVVTLIAALRPGGRWRPYGIYATLVLWIAQIGWGAYGLATS